MVVFRNFDVHTRVWPGLQRADGRTLELEPGEECELQLPEDFADEHLRAVPRKRLRPINVVGPSEDPPFLTPSDAGSSDVAVTTEQES